MTRLDTQPIPAREQIRTPPSIIAGILAVSVAASLFIAWLVYVHPPIDAAGNRLAFLPALNAVLNALAAIALVLGFRFVMRREIHQHRASMFTAFVFSSAFLVSYLTNHALHGETRIALAHHGALWMSYLVLLISHITLSVVALPMILITFFLSLTGRFPQHRALARWTFPIWLYVSVTGVLVFVAQEIARA